MEYLLNINVSSQTSGFTSPYCSFTGDSWLYIHKIGNSISDLHSIRKVHFHGDGYYWIINPQLVPVLLATNNRNKQKIKLVPKYVYTDTGGVSIAWCESSSSFTVYYNGSNWCIQEIFAPFTIMGYSKWTLAQLPTPGTPSVESSANKQESDDGEPYTYIIELSYDVYDPYLMKSDSSTTSEPFGKYVNSKGVVKTISKKSDVMYGHPVYIGSIASWQ